MSYYFPQNCAHSLINSTQPCLMPCWILVPRPGTELAPSAVKAREVLAPGPFGNSLDLISFD